MSQKIIIILSAIAFGIGIALWNTTPPTALVEEDNSAVRNFAFTSIDGRSRTLSDFHDKMVFVNGWFTLCPPCTAEMPQLLELAKKHPDDMVLITLSVDRNREALQRYIDRLPEDIRSMSELDNVFFVFDDNKLISRTMLNIKVFPETVIIDRQGHQLYRIKGAIDWFDPEVEKIFPQHTDENI